MPVLLLLSGHATAGGRCFAAPMGENGRGTSSQMVQFDNPLDKMNGSQEADSEGIFDPEQPPSPAATAERTEHTGKTSKKPKKFPSIDLGSGDIENSVASGISASLGKVGRRTTVDENAMPTPDPKVTKAMLRAAFDKIDADGSMELDKEERDRPVLWLAQFLESYDPSGV